MTALKEAAAKDKRFFRELAACRTEEEALRKIDEGVRDSVNLNALTGRREERIAAIAEVFLTLPPWLSVLQKLTASGFDPLVRPRHPCCTHAALACLVNFIEQFCFSTSTFSPFGSLYEKLPNIHLDDEGGCSVIAAAKYLLDFKPDLTAQAWSDESESLPALVRCEGGFEFDMMNYFSCALLDTLACILMRAEEGKDYNPVFAYNRALGKVFKGIVLYRNPYAENPEKEPEPAFKECGETIEITGFVALRFEDSDIVFSGDCIPLVDNSEVPENALAVPADGAARGLAGKRLRDICLYREEKADSEYRALRMTAEFRFEDDTALVLKTDWNKHPVITVERTAAPKRAEDYEPHMEDQFTFPAKV
jgi:hypothetical protein